MYSGHVAGAVFAALEIPQLCLVMCPNHTGVGRALAIVSEGAWETPLGNVPIDSEFAAALKQRCPLLHEDSSAHRSEHAAEVELPFLQMLQPQLRFVPIAVGTGKFETLEQLGSAIADVIAAHHSPVLIVASSDMNHYESDAITRVKDHSAIEPILRPRRPRPLRRGHPAAHQHVWLRSGGRYVDRSEEARRNFGGAGQIRNLR